MHTIIIKENEAGQRFDKFLQKYFQQAPKSFSYKMLRKKNIVLNGKKADGSERLQTNDQIQLFLSEETILKFTKPDFKPVKSDLDILYEDTHILVLNKPSGILSQRSTANDISMVEKIISYLLETNFYTLNDLKSFRPSVCNRLDRNTSGVLLAGKTMLGLQMLSELLKERSASKYYICAVSGILEKECILKGFLKKDGENNQAIIKKEAASKEDLPIETHYIPLAFQKGDIEIESTLLKIKLVTGRSHQIRAHLASIGHPIIGDIKYGYSRINQVFHRRYQIQNQLLHAFEFIFPENVKGELSYLSHRKFRAPLPRIFQKFIKGEQLVWLPGIQEDFEDLL